MKKIDGEYELYEENVIHDQDVKNNVFYTVLVKINRVFNELKDIEDGELTYRAGKIVTGVELAEIVFCLKIQLNLLERLMKDADDYKIKHETLDIEQKNKPFAEGSSN